MTVCRCGYCSRWDPERPSDCARYASHPLPLVDALPDLVRAYLASSDWYADTVVDPADAAAWIGGTVAGDAWRELQREMAHQMAALRTDECDCDLDPSECRCRLVAMAAPRLLLEVTPGACACVCVHCVAGGARWWDARVGEHDSVCRAGHELVVRETTAVRLEDALRWSVAAAANDGVGGAA